MGGRVASPTFVGRVEELQVLEAARSRAVDGEPAVVLVGGEAGVGKTRRGEYLMFAQDLDSRFEALREAVRLIPATRHPRSAP
jgi:2-phosphoglycerate kinase